MARGKHSTALFEVINSGKKPPGGLKSSTGKPLEGKAAAASLMRTPKWWFKARSKPDKKPNPAPAPAAVSNDPTANVTAATLTAPRSPISPSAASASPVSAPAAIVEEPASEPSVVVRDYSDPEPILAERYIEPDPDPQPETAASADPVEPCKPGPALVPAAPRVKVLAMKSRRGEARRPGIRFGVDRDRQEITLQMRYTTAIISSFVVLVVIAGAYVIGRHLGESASGGAPPLTTVSTRQLKSGPAQPGVLEVGRDHARLATAKINGVTPPQNLDPFEDAPVDSAGIADRNVSPNYVNFVLVTTFPPEQSGTAIKACDFLCKHGVTCTLERDVPGEPAHWLSVVGTRGFPHKFRDSKEYMAYRAAILALNDKFPARSSFSRFDPMPFKWEGH